MEKCINISTKHRGRNCTFGYDATSIISSEKVQ
jgi:hypothetical protein